MMPHKTIILMITIIILCIPNLIPAQVILIPDSPKEFKSNTWLEKNWVEIDVNSDGPIMQWTINYTWLTDLYPGDASFHVTSPSGTNHNIAAGEFAGSYTKTFSSFYAEPASGKWRFWIEDYYADGGCMAESISLSIMTATKYLNMTIPETAVEGMGQLTGTITAIPTPENDLIVNLISFSMLSDRVSVPATITIPAGINHMPFVLSIIDDTLLNGRSDVQIIASSNDYLSTNSKISIDDNESATLSIILPEIFHESEQTMEGRIVMNRPAVVNLEIPLISSNTSLISMPDSIILIAGITEATFPVFVNNFDIEQSITITSTMTMNHLTINSATIHMIPEIIPETERMALIDLYNSTNGAKWKTKDNWLGNPGTECNWFGVFCDDSGKHVTSINLFANNLINALPESISDLQHLTTLSLPGNQLLILPESLASLQKLSVLNVSNNQLKNLPENLGKLKSLSKLYINNNQFINIPETICSLNNLSDLNLANNQLSRLPECFGYLSNLVYLDMTNNQLHTLPDNFGSLENLDTLIATDNQLKKLPESFGNLQNLKEIQLNNNELSMLPESFAILQNLNMLIIKNNPLQSLPELFGNLQNLYYLDIRNSQLSSLPESFCHLQKLETLEVHESQINSLPESFDNLQNLKYLTLYDLQLHSLPESFGNLQNLSRIVIGNTPLKHLPESFGNLQNLSSLTIYETHLSSLPENFGNLQNLSELYLYENQLSSLPESFGNLQNLSWLDLHDNQLKSLPENFCNLQYLPYLFLYNNQMSSLPENIGNLQNLRQLHLNNNQLSSLPESVGNLQYLDDLRLEYNQLNTLPESIVNLTSLTFLSANDNLLKYLPENIGNLQTLPSMKLGNNHLTYLPESFGNLQNLSYLELENNQLTSLPEQFIHLQNLTSLWLSNNQLSSLPEGFGSLQNLFDLDLSGNQLNCLPDSFDNLINLSTLKLSDNQLSSIPENIGNFQKLEILYLESNQLNFLPDSFCSLQKLYDLNLSVNHLSNLPENFGNLKSLLKISIYHNQLNSLPDSFGLIDENSILDMNKLLHLDLSSNQLTQLPDSFDNLAHLEYLDLSINQIQFLPLNIGNLTKLINLNLSKNCIQILPDSIGRCTSLSKFNISFNNLEKMPSSIGNVMALEEIKASNNQLEKIPESMKQLSNLQSIDFSYNVIEQFPYELSSIHGLQHINLSNNRILGIEDDIQHFTHLLTLNLSGNRSNSNFYISSKIEELVNLQWLDLSDSYLSDEDLPPELFNLKKIRFLSLSHNGIKTIPENIKNLTNLVTLSLSNCPISSNITKSLCYLENLRSLNLSHNKELIYSWNGSEIIGEKPMTGDIPIEFLNLKNLISIDLSGTKLYTSSPTLEKFISERSITGWDNSLPELPERQPLSINYITTTSDNMGYSIHATIPIVIVFTQPVRLTNGNLMISLETGDTDLVIRIPSFSLSYTATGLYTVQEGDFSEDLNVKSIKLSDGASLTSENGDEINLLLADNMNLADMKNIHVDGTRPWINMTFPDTLCVKDIYTIKGESTDIAQNFLINLTVFDNQNNQVFQENQNFFGNTTEQWEFTPPQSIWQHNMTYSIQIDIRDFAGNTSRLIKDVTFGKKLSTISTHLTNNQIFLGQTARITGIISPAENVIGEEVTVKLRSPKGEILGRKVNANADGSFQYPLQCDDIHQAGIWYVSTAWEGTSCLESAVSNSIVMTVNHAPSQIVLDSTYSSVKMGDTVTITGKVISKYYCENHMNNIPILLEISGPEKSGHSEFISLETMDKLGSFQTNYSNFDVLGEWKLHAIIGEKTDFGIYSDAHAYTVSESLHINVVETAGYAIIVQGKITSEEGLASHNKTTNDVYHSLKQRGLLDEDILYFNYDNDQAFYKITDQTIAQLFDDDVPENIISLLKQEAIFNREYKSEAEFISKLASLDEQLLMYQSQILAHSSRGIEVDGLPSKKAIKKAIIADIPEIMGNKPANLYIVMVDHGTEDTFYIEPDIITDVELNEWLTELENTPGWNQEIILMLGFCFSGSFIDELSKPNRIIITSAGPDEFSYKGPLDQDNIREGEYFISEFFKSVALGKNIKASFSQAVIQTEMFTSIGDGSVNAPPFFDNSAQHPLLDDNGDKVGTNNVDDFDNDGNLSQDIIIGVSSLTMNDPGNVIVTEVSESIFLGPDENTTDKIMAKVSDDLRLLSLWIEIKPPNFVPNAVGSGQVEMNLPRIVYSRYDDATDCYQWNSESLLNIFDVPGTYHIYYFAKDINSKNVSPMKESIVYKASAVNHPPEPFNLLYPSNDIEITSLGVLAATSGTPTADSYTMISWEDTIDPDNDRLSYTLFFKKDNDQFDQGENRIKLSDLTNNFHEINLPDEWDGSTVYWKVQAIDSYGAIQNSTVNRFMINNANNPSNGTLWGYVYDAATNKPVQRVGIAVKSGGSLIKRMMTMSTGKYFSAFRPLSNYHIVVEKEGYEVIEKSPVNVPKDDRCRLDFYLVADTSNIPQLSEISSQTINEGESFIPISLDNYITDGNNEKHEITWSATGNTELNVTIDDSRTASITVSNKDWFGAETIIFSAEDPEGNKGDTSATFTIKGVNDAPVVTNISDQIIYDFSTFQPIILDNCVVDVDHAANEITWETMGQKNLMVSIKDRIAKISLRDKQWRGYENIMFTATDPSGAFGVKMAMFTVLNSNFVYDLNNNGTIDLGDMIMVLQIFTNVYVDKEWISDQQIGFDDLLLIMNRLSR